MSTCYRYRDMNGQPAVNTPLTIRDQGKTYQALSDNQGIVKFSETFSDQAQVIPVGLATYFKISCDNPPPPKPGPGISENGRVGTSCTILAQGDNGVYFYAIQHDRNGLLTSFHRMDWDQAKAQGERIAACFEIPPPPPKTIPEISAEVSVLQKIINSGLSKIDALFQGLDELRQAVAKQGQDLTAGINGIWDKLEAWLIDRIIGIFLKALDKEVERLK